MQKKKYNILLHFYYNKTMVIFHKAYSTVLHFYTPNA